MEAGRDGDELDKDVDTPLARGRCLGVPYTIQGNMPHHDVEEHPIDGSQDGITQEFGIHLPF